MAFKVGRWKYRSMVNRESSAVVQAHINQRHRVLSFILSLHGSTELMLDRTVFLQRLNSAYVSRTCSPWVVLVYLVREYEVLCGLPELIPGVRKQSSYPPTRKHAHVHTHAGLHVRARLRAPRLSISTQLRQTQHPHTVVWVTRHTRQPHMSERSPIRGTCVCV